MNENELNDREKLEVARRRIAELEAKVSEQDTTIAEYEFDLGNIDGILTGKDMDIADLKAKVAELEAKSRWISVEDRRPDRGQLCIVWRKYDNGRVVLARFNEHRNSKDWYSRDFGYLTTDVLYWMPIEPPEDGEG